MREYLEYFDEADRPRIYASNVHALRDLRLSVPIIYVSNYESHLSKKCERIKFITLCYVDLHYNNMKPFLKNS